MEKKREGFDFRAKLTDLKPYGGMIQPGNYAIQFQFKVPDPLPASFKLKKTKHRADPVAKVEHEIKIKLKGTNYEDTPTFKTKLKIRNDRGRWTGKPLVKSATHDVVCCCCCSKGTAKSTVAFEREFFYLNEKAHAKVSIDNTGVTVENSEVRYNITQHLNLKVDHHQFHWEKVLAT